jgi:hypothetical protein
MDQEPASRSPVIPPPVELPEPAPPVLVAVPSPAHEKKSGEVIVVHPGGASTSVKWGWSDYLGLVMVLLATTFLLTVVVALIRRESPLKILRIIKAPLMAGIRRDRVRS